MIVGAGLYRDGRREPVDEGIGTLAGARSPGVFAWLGLRLPNDAELAEVERAFGIPEAAMRDARRVHERPKVERHGDVLLIVIRTARYVDTKEVVEFGELFAYLGPDFLVTIRYGHAAPLGGVRAGLEADPDLLAHGPGVVLAASLASVVAGYTPVIEGLEHDIREVERDVFSDTRYDPTRRIYLLIRETLDFLVALEPLTAALDRLTAPTSRPWIGDTAGGMLQDVQDDLARALERSRTAHSLLSNALAANATQVSLRQNEDMRRISAWVAIGVVPTLVAGLFGMNLDGIPGASHPASFTLVCLLTALFSVLLHRRLRRSGWL